MHKGLREGLVAGAAHVFSLLRGEPASVEQIPATTGSVTALARLQVSGSVSKVLLLGLDAASTAEVAGLLSPGSQLSDGLTEDVVCELLNMVAESARTLMNQMGETIELEAPEVADVRVFDTVSAGDCFSVLSDQTTVTFGVTGD